MNKPNKKTTNNNRIFGIAFAVLLFFYILALMGCAVDSQHIAPYQEKNVKLIATGERGEIVVQADDKEAHQVDPTRELQMEFVAPATADVDINIDNYESTQYDALQQHLVLADLIHQASTEKPDPTAIARQHYPDIWGRIRDGYGMQGINSPLVKRWEKSYSANPKATEEMLSKGGRYIFFIVDELEKRGMPTELALLPFVESAMNPSATSSAQAAGLWQFIPSTGRAFDMKQNWWADQRRDVIKSTQGALDFLQKMNLTQRKDWHLTLASYNMGEGGLNNAVRAAKAAGKKGDYMSLSISNETRNYVPKLLAIKNIISNPKAFGITLPQVPNRPYFTIIEKTKPMDMLLAAKFAGLTAEDFIKLNPTHNKPVITAKNHESIVIPADSADQFFLAMDEHTKAGRPLVTWQPRVIKPGETLASIGKKAGLSDQDLRKINVIPHGARILPGTKILAPALTVVSTASEQKAAEVAIESFSGARIYERVDVPAHTHIVGKKETPHSISEKYGINVTKLRSINGISEQIVGFLKRGVLLVIEPAYSKVILTTENGEKKVVSTQNK